VRQKREKIIIPSKSILEAQVNAISTMLTNAKQEITQFFHSPGGIGKHEIGAVAYTALAISLIAIPILTAIGTAIRILGTVSCGAALLIGSLIIHTHFQDLQNLNGLKKELQKIGTALKTATTKLHPKNLKIGFWA